MRQTIKSNTEDASSVLRSRKIANLASENQGIVCKRQGVKIEKCIVDVWIFSIHIPLPMEFVQFGQSRPYVRKPYFWWYGFSGKAFVYWWNDGGVEEIRILSVSFKYRVCPPIAHHHFREILNLRIEFVEYIFRYRGENVVMDVLYHIVDIWIKIGIDFCHC